MLSEPNDSSNVRKLSRSPYPKRGSSFGEMTAQSPIGTDLIGTKLYTRRGQLAGFDGPLGPPTLASSGFGGLGDLVSDAKILLFSSSGLILLGGILAIVGYKKGWFEDLKIGD